jgi:hypothetical protein
MKLKYLLYITGGVLFFTACQPEEKKEEFVKTEEHPKVAKAHVVPPDFNSDSAFAYVKTQADMGPRTPGSKAHDKAVAYFEKQFKKYGAEVIIQKGNVTTYDNKPWVLKNIIATYNPKAQDRILLCAHWDSRPFADKDKTPENNTKACPGVNDGASGVGVLMEVARVISSKSPNVGVDIILFDLEDYGDDGGDPDTWCLGSQYWSKNLHTPYYGAKFGILLDMVGAKGATFYKEEISATYASETLNKVWSTAHKLGYSNYFLNQQMGAMTDDHKYVNELAQVPCIDIIDYRMNMTTQRGSFFEHHHTIADDINTIDKATLKAVGQTLLEVIYNE